MRSLRKLALAAAGLLAVLLLAAILLPLAFRDRIVARIQQEVNASVDARVSWRDASLGILRDFPDISLRLEGTTVVGNAPFAGDTLLAMPDARLVLGLGSVVRHLASGRPVVVREVILDRPVARLRVLEDGRANWDVVRSSSTGSAGRDVHVTLRELRLEDGRIDFDDRHARLRATVHGLDEVLGGDFARERFTLRTRTMADSVSIEFAGVPYLSRASVQLDAEVDADLATHRFAFRRDTLRVNALSLAFEGTLGTAPGARTVDLRFAAPGTAFRDILSLVPVIYRNDFAELRTSGTMSFAGRVSGAYGEGALPAFAIRAAVQDGAFRYPSLPLGARDIAMQLAVNNPGGDADRTIISVERFHAVVGRHPVDARLVVRTPVSDPDVDFRLRGILDLADVARTVKLEGVQSLAGVANADVAMRARLSDVDARRYERVDAQGAVHLSRVTLRTQALPRPVAIDTVALRLTPRAAELGILLARVGASDVRATGSLENILGFALRDDDLRARADVRSTRFDLADWSSSEALEVVPVPPRLDASLDVAVGTAVHGKLAATAVRGAVRLRDQRATLDELRMYALGGSAVVSGWYETTDSLRPRVDVVLAFDTLDIPSSFATVVTVQRLAPVARWAQGRVSGAFSMRGPLDRQMTPIFTEVDGAGEFETRGLSLRGVPVLDKLGGALALERLRNPVPDVVRGAFEISDGRVTVKPFIVRLADLDVTVSGSHGLDQTLRYDLSLALPRALVAGATGAAVTKLATAAGRQGVALSGDQAVRVAAQVTGTVTEPVLSLRFAGIAESAREAVSAVVREEIASRAGDVREKADSALEEARRRARAEADSAIADAERQAAAIRAEARAAAERIRQEANARADSLVARATNPAARIAAQAATDRIRREAEQRAERAIAEADARADAVVTAARRRAEGLD